MILRDVTAIGHRWNLLSGGKVFMLHFFY